MIAWFPTAFWTVPLMGAVACGLAFLFGRRYLSVKPNRLPDEDADRVVERRLRRRAAGDGEGSDGESGGEEREARSRHRRSSW